MLWRCPIGFTAARIILRCPVHPSTTFAPNSHVDVFPSISVMFLLLYLLILQMHIIFPMLIYQIYNLLSCLGLNESRNASDLAHHTIAIVLALLSLWPAPFFQYYCVGFMGNWKPPFFTRPLFMFHLDHRGCFLFFCRRLHGVEFHLSLPHLRLATHPLV
jgi:hypothetical protein